MFVITVFGWENRAATRLLIGCEAMAERTRIAADNIKPGFTTRVNWMDVPPTRSEEETERANRLTRSLAPQIFGGQP
jgi:hypothetical protein